MSIVFWWSTDLTPLFNHDKIDQESKNINKYIDIIISKIPREKEENMKKISIFILMISLVLTTCIYGEKVAEFEDIFRPENIMIEGDFLVIPQREIVSIYSLKNFQLIAQVGKKGEGPGEIKESAYVTLFPDSIVLYSMGKILWFTKDGKLIKEMKVNNELRYVTPVEKNYLAAREVSLPGRDESQRVFTLFDPNLKKIKDIYETKNDASKGRAGVFKEVRILSETVESAIYKDKIFIADSQNGFVINVYNHDGNLLYSIKKEMEPIEVGEIYKENVKSECAAYNQMLWARIKDLIVFPKYFPPIRSFFISDDKIFATTFKEKDNKHELIIMDLKGKVLKQGFALLPSWKIYKHNRRQRDLFTVKNGKIYQLVDNPNKELYELHVSDWNTYL